MKLVQCNECGDMFNLRMEDKSCSCGKTTGRYVDNSHAVVTGPHMAIAIGNGSYHDAVRAAPKEQSDWRYDSRRPRVLELFKELTTLAPTMFLGWSRMPDGPTNSHSKIKE